MKVWCDGAYKESLKQGGIGIVWTENGKVIKKFSKGYRKDGKRKVTNQTMEMAAAMTALTNVTEPLDSLEIVTDSMYVVKNANKEWKRKANIKLWNKFDTILERTQKLVKTKIKFTHTYGHAEDKFNNMADRLADEASKEFIE